MDERTRERADKISEFFGLGADAGLLTPGATEPKMNDEMAEGFDHFQIEWHVIPRAEILALDDSYFSSLYTHAPRDFTRAREHKPSYRDVLVKGHERHQGRVVGVETTRKPRYLPENRQFYGTAYGHDPTADPFAAYMGRAGMVNGTRYAHNYLSLREFVRVVNEDWRARGLLPEGYRATVSRQPSSTLSARSSTRSGARPRLWNSASTATARATRRATPSARTGRATSPSSLRSRAKPIGRSRDSASRSCRSEYIGVTASAPRASSKM